MQGDLTRMDAQSVTEAEARGTKIVHGLLGDERFRSDADHARALAPFTDLSDGRIVEFLYRLGLDLVAPWRRTFSLRQPGELAWKAHIALTCGLEVAKGWPSAFVDALDTMCDWDKPGRWLLDPEKAIERWLARLPTGSGMAIRSATERYRLQVGVKPGPATD